MKKIFLLLAFLITTITFAQVPARHNSGVVIGGGTADPTGVKAGQIWWDSDDLKFRKWDGSAWSDLVTAGATPTLESVLNSGKYADSPDGNNYIDINTMINGATASVEFGFDDGGTQNGSYYFDGGSMYFNNNDNPNGATLDLNAYGVLLGRTISTFDSWFRIADPTVDNIDFWLRTPSGASASTDYTIPLSVNGTFADVNGDITIAGGESTTVSDTAEINLTLTGSDITADIVSGSIGETKLDASTNASLNLADTALQSEVDGSTTNELQTIANTSDATSHTATLSNSGGSLQLIEGSGITLSTGGTGLDGTVTITSTTSGADGLGPDGDKGDITVGGGGTTLTIDNASVTLAKMANVATGTVFYRKTAATGVPEVQTLATLKTDLGLTGTNSGDQTSIVGITGTKAQFDTALSDGNFLYVGDVTSNATHTGEVTGSTALTIASGVVDSDNIANATVDELDLDASVNASLDLADSSVQQTGSPISGYVTTFSSSGVVTGTSNLTYSTVAGRADIGTAQDVLRLKSAAGSAYIDVDNGNGNINVVGDNITAPAFVKTSGTASQFLKADGSVDSSTYLTSQEWTRNLEGTVMDAYYGTVLTPTTQTDNAFITSANNKASGFFSKNTGTGTLAYSYVGVSNNGASDYDDTAALIKYGTNYTSGYLTGNSSLYNESNPFYFVGASTSADFHFVGGLSATADQENVQTLLTLDTDGSVLAPSLTTALITSGGNSSLITKEYGDANYIGGDANTLDTFDSTQFLRSDTSDSYTSGNLTFDNSTQLRIGSTATAGSVGGLKLQSTGSTVYADMGDNINFRDAGSGFSNRFTFNRAGDLTLHSGDLIDTNGTASTTGTVLNLSDNITGKLYNVATPSAATTFTTTAPKTGGYAQTYINTTSQPTVTGATLRSGATWVTGTNMKIVVGTDDGTNVYYYFIAL